MRARVDHRRNQRIARWIAVGALGAASVLVASVSGADASPQPSRSGSSITDADLAPHRPGVLLVGYSSTATLTDKAAVRASAKASSSKVLSPRAKRTEVISLAKGESVAAAVARVKGTKGVRYVEPDYLLTTAATSNDPYYTNGSLWGMQGDGTSPANEFGSAAGEAWAQGHTGSRSVAVGVIDEGIQFAHPDLAANVWTNPDEIAGNGIDDDANGYVDDIHGWDFLNNNNTVFDGNSTEGSDTHGTHVSGTIGGIGGNGAGVAGVNWAVTIVSAKFLGPSGGYTSDAARGIDYLTALKVNKGLNIVATSNSWGGGGSSSTMLDAINNAGDQGILFVAAAGNSTTNNDAAGSYPSNYECTKGGTRGWDCVIAVASTTSSGALSSFSSYGATTVDIAAPGSGVWSTYPVDTYSSLSGTSMATPHVSGAIALCASINPALSARQLKRAVVNSARPTPSLAGKVANSGRLDVGAMVTACTAPTAAVTGSPTSLTATANGANRMSLTWADGASDEQHYEIERAAFTNSVCGTYALVATVGAGNTSFLVGGLTGSTTYCFRVRAVNDFGGGTSATSDAATGTTASPPASYACTATSFSWIDTTAGTPSLHTLGDDSSTSVSLPFSFPLFGTSFTSAQIASNGFVRLGSGAATAYSNLPIPSAGDPENVIAAWWDDLNPAAGGSVWSMTLGSSPNRQFVVTWSNVPHYGTVGSEISTQIVLDEATGAVTLQYLDTVTGLSTSNGGAAATIGIENSDGTVGTQIGYNQAVLADGTALRCTDRPVNSPTITTASLAVGTVGTAYSQTLTGSAGTTPYTWSVNSGSLPAGLSLDPSTGEIGGNPTAAGTSSFSIKITDSASLVATRSLSITIAAPVTVTTASLASGAVGTAYSATLAASGGTGTYTWSVTGGSLPTGLSLASSTGRISGTPTTAATTTNFTVTATDGVGRTSAKPLSITVSGAIPTSFKKSAPSNNASSRPRNGLVLTWAASTGVVSYEYCFDTNRNSVCNSSWVSVGSARTVTLGLLASKTSYEWQVRAVNTTGTRLANNGTWWKFTTAT